MNIDKFKNAIGGGVRPSLFRVRGNIGTTTSPDSLSFLVTAAQLPASTLGEIAVPFRGRNIYVSGDRPAPETWTTTFYNDTDFMVRNAMERWHNGINDFANNTGAVNSADYQTDLFVEQLDRDDTILKTYIFRAAYPLTIAAIDLSTAEATEIETFEVTWRYQHFEPSAVSF